jgi:UTP--glucose-1-phosphate uridylyltransferase
MEPKLTVIPAAGLGVRMRHAAGGGPKELLPVAGEPAIAYALQESALAGIFEAAVILRPGKEQIRQKLLDRRRALPAGTPEGKLRLHFFFQKTPMGECDAIALARECAGSKPAAVFYPDNIPRPPGALRALCHEFRKHPCDLVALMRVTTENDTALGCSGRVKLAKEEELSDRRRSIKNFLPKEPGLFRRSRPEELRVCGIYIALPHYFDFIELARTRLKPGQELTDGQTRRIMLQAGVPLWGLPLAGEVHDVGIPEGYERAIRLIKSDGGEDPAATSSPLF